MDRISAMRVFSEVVTRGSFTAAAETLGMSRAMVTRHIAELERWLGTRLLQRSTRRLSLTEAGEACMARSRQLLELVNDVEQVVGQRDTEPHGPIRVTAPVALGQTHLAPALVAYLARYPRTRVDLQLGDQAVHFAEDRTDLAVRITSAIDPGLMALKLSVCRSVLCATPDYLVRHGRPQVLDDLAGHNCLNYSRFSKSQWNLVRDGQETAVHVSGNLSANLSANETSTLLQAVLAGGGVAMLPTFMVAPLLRSGALVSVLPDWQPTAQGICGVYLSRRHQPATLRTLLNFLAAQWSLEPSWDLAI